MKERYKIGKGSENDILLHGKNCLNAHAEIKYERGNWILLNSEEANAIYVNNEKVNAPIKLLKYDKLRICNQTIYWSDYLYEGDKQELTKKDFMSFHGRISRSNFRELSLLTFGLTICIFFLPGLLVAVWKQLNRRRFMNENTDTIETIQQIAPTVYSIGFGLLGLIFLLLVIKRLRDTGNPTWKLIIPIYNLKLLYLNKSKK